ETFLADSEVMRELVEHRDPDLALELRGVRERLLERLPVDRDLGRHVRLLLEEAEQILIVSVLVLDVAGDVLEPGSGLPGRRAVLLGAGSSLRAQGAERPPNAVREAPHGYAPGARKARIAPPSGAFTAVAVPPCASTTWRTIASPSPEPGLPRAVGAR